MKNYLLFVRTECQKTIERNSHQYPIILEYYQNIIEMIDWWTFDRENEEKGKFLNAGGAEKLNSIKSMEEYRSCLLYTSPSPRD